MTWRRRVVLVIGVVGVSVLVVGGCDKHDTHQLSVNQKKWQSADVTTYTFTFTSAGQAGPTSQVLRVVNGEATTPSTGDGPTTMDDVFSLVRHELQHDDKATVSFDETLGYPTTARFDEKSGTMDDEWGFSITDFTSPPGQSG